MTTEFMSRESPSREIEERLAELQAVHDLAVRVLRPEVARLWLRSPVPALGYRKPLDLLKKGDWQVVIDQLLALAERITA